MNIEIKERLRNFHLFFWAFMMIFLSLIYYLIVYKTEKRGLFFFLTKEGGFLETIQSISLISSSLILFFTYQQLKIDQISYRKRVFPLIFGLIFLFAGLEECNWGQSWLNFSHPEFFNRWNLDNEFNIHDLNIYGINMAKVTFFFVRTTFILYLCLSLTIFVFPKVCDFANHYHILTLPTALYPFFLLAIIFHSNTLMQISGLSSLEISWNRHEISELLFDLTFLGATISKQIQWSYYL